MSTTEENKALIQRFVEEAFNRGNLDIADEVYAPRASPPTIPPLLKGQAALRMSTIR